MVQVYAWEGDLDRLILVEWFRNSRGEVRGEVVNGGYPVERAESPGQVRLSGWDNGSRARYVCPAPEGKGYNEILARVHPVLFPL